MDRVAPNDVKSLCEIVAWAADQAVPLDIAGTGSKRALGRPVQAEVTVALERLSGVVAYEPEELVLTAQAGTPLAEIAARLAERRQHLAFEPPDLGPLLGEPAGGGTLGGLVASGLSGPRRIKDGGCRDHVLGVAAVNGRGEAFKAGGRVVKNVTGYDVGKLLTGSFGTLAALTEVTMKVLPAPEDVRTLVLTGRDDAGAVAALTAALQSPHEVSGAAHLPAPLAARSAVPALAGAGQSVTLIRLEGFTASVAARVAALAAELGADGTLDPDASRAAWSEVRDVAYFVTPAERAVWKLSVPPAAGPRVAAALRAALPVELYYDWGGGLLWVAVDAAGDAGAGPVRAAIQAAGGHATLIRVPEAVRAAVPVFEPLPPPLAALAERVKESFDPRRVLNPGRMYAGV